MSWRTVIVSKRCKLEYKLGYLICRGEEMKKVFLNEIATLVIESTGVALTAALLCELIKNKTNIIFCDEKHNPHSQLNALYGRHDCSGMLRKQLLWSDKNKKAVWTEIVRQKLWNQQAFLRQLGDGRAELIRQYIEEVQYGDSTNREGHAAKVYFDSLFGLRFKRGDNTYINAALNYGYAIILSAFNREIIASGYDTRLGVFHCSEFNHYNLSCDFMEPYRILVDRAVFFWDTEEFSSDYKHYLCNILNQMVKINGTSTTVADAISIYVKSVCSALNSGDTTLIKNYEF